MILYLKKHFDISEFLNYNCQDSKRVYSLSLAARHAQYAHYVVPNKESKATPPPRINVNIMLTAYMTE